MVMDGPGSGGWGGSRLNGRVGDSGRRVGGRMRRRRRRRRSWYVEVVVN